MTGTRARVLAPIAAVLALVLAVALVWLANARARPVHRLDVHTVTARASADDCPSEVQCVIAPVRTSVSSSISAAFSNTALPLYESAIVGAADGRRYSEIYVEQLDDGVVMTLTVRCPSVASSDSRPTPTGQTSEYTVPGQIQFTEPGTNGCSAALILDVPAGYTGTLPLGPAKSLLALPSIQLSR